ncbi:element excision factor XisI family protein [Coleofasciculus sp. G2-EDA-02]|uniref:element excision factor XisI family protein n=1 Tax=Coleofasciculus sp. G2-EDA-02 TaxID=3069529 RepID=UPI0032F0E087
MERLETYRQLVQQVLAEHSHFQSSYGEVETFPVFDTERDHYQVVSVGWENRRRVYGCLIHVDIKGDKIWIQHDGTETGVANELVELGVAKQDIVLGYHAPYARQYTEFAVS